MSKKKAPKGKKPKQSVKVITLKQPPEKMSAGKKKIHTSPKVNKSGMLKAKYGSPIARSLEPKQYHVILVYANSSKQDLGVVYEVPESIVIEERRVAKTFKESTKNIE
ncbi:MAG: hypothetical protein ACP5OG_02120 [Candidatus Nanoarchaeia archaeon]